MPKYDVLSVDLALAEQVEGLMARKKLWRNKRACYHDLLRRGLEDFATPATSPAPPPAAAPIAEPRATAPQEVPPPAPAPAVADEGRGRPRRGRPPKKKDAELEDDDDVGEPPEPPKGSWTCPDCGGTMPWLDKVNHDCPALRRPAAGTKQATIGKPPEKVDVDLAPVKEAFRAETVYGRTRAAQLSWLRSQFNKAGAKAPPEDEAKEILEAWIEELRPAPAPKTRAPAPPRLNVARLLSALQGRHASLLAKDHSKDPQERRLILQGLVKWGAQQQGVEIPDGEAARLVGELFKEAVA